MKVALYVSLPFGAPRYFALCVVILTPDPQKSYLAFSRSVGLVTITLFRVFVW